MPKKKGSEIKTSCRTSRPPLSPEARENQMIALAVDCAEQMLRDGTAPAQIVTHYLKLGTAKERLEREKLEEENKLLRAKTESLEAAKNSELDYKEVLKAMKSYSGLEEEEYENYDEY